MSFLGLEDRQWIFVATVVYASTFVLGTYSAIRLRRRAAHIYVVGLVFIGWVLQTIGLYARGLQYGGCPLANRFELVQFVVWSAIALYIFVGPAFRVSLLGVFTSGLATALSIISLLIPRWDTLDQQPLFGDSPWIEMHAALALFSYGVFGIQALTSIMYLMQSRSLKRKQMGGLFPFLPSIVELAKINVRLVLIGFVILTLALTIGSVYFARDRASVDELKLAATIAVWLAYGAMMGLRHFKTLTSKQFSWACIAVFLIALVSLDAVHRSRAPALPAAWIESGLPEHAHEQR